MAKRSSIELAACVLLSSAALSMTCAAQTSSSQQPAPCQSSGTSQNKTCPPSTATPKHPSTADQFPFPGDTGADMPGAPAPNAPAPNAPAPNAPASGASHSSAAADHPFPGDAPSSSSSSDAGSSSSSGSNSDTDPGDAASSKPADTDAPAPTPGRKKLPKVERIQSDEERAAEDLNVASFYESSGDLNAAYLRAKDAVKYQPNDSDAHFTLAHLAQRLKKRDEAIAEFNAYLKLDPDGLKIKQARKALSELQREHAQ
ncbi:tetratricopeptide repeat protein [Edaphobacter bradus]|uniref:tetratricopeptide repeat protein n=1 Tax=Edaphobacter bradus TaxID=2259016 RepID=UPI0021E0896E|nr:tetratricopeptide repeat protein [Edaphobacter bradus]